MKRSPANLGQAVNHLFELLVQAGGLGPALTVFALLRTLVILGAGVWLFFSPQSPETQLIWWLFLAFTGYSLLLYIYTVLFGRKIPIPRLDLWVFAMDLLLCYLFVRLTGGTTSDFAPAFFLITSLQAYYYGLNRGLAASAASALLYLGSEWPALPSVHWTTAAIRIAFLFLIASALGVLAERERQQREAILGLNRDLDQERERVRRIVESIHDGIIVLDRQGRITDWNRAMEERYAIPATEVRGKSILETFPILKAEGFEEILANILGGQEEVVLEGFEHETRFRGRITMNIKGSPLRTPTGEVIGAVLALEDVTERRQLELIARQSEKMAAVGTLAAGIAHEINNPIGIITSRVELMLMEAREKPLPPEVTKDLRVVEKHAGRVAKITQGLLSFSRQTPWRLTTVDVNQVVEEALLLVEKQLAKEQIALKKNLAGDLPKIQGSPNHLEQVLVNLLTNAREAMTNGGTLRLETRRAQEMIEIWITDTGSGIPAEVLPRIFDPFFTTKEQGTGLGLSISYGIVREHGGAITVESRPGDGSTFTVRLPIQGSSRGGGIIHGERADPRH